MERLAHSALHDGVILMVGEERLCVSSIGLLAAEAAAGRHGDSKIDIRWLRGKPFTLHMVKWLQDRRGTRRHIASLRQFHARVYIRHKHTNTIVRESQEN